MPINFPVALYSHAYDTFARVVTITPVASQPGEPAYAARGIFNTMPVDVLAMDNSIFSEQKTILDILETEFSVLPLQNDLIDIPSDSGLPALGQWVVMDVDTNGGGESTCTLRKVVAASP